MREDLGGRGGLAGWRRVRGDGNCYYRAFMLGWLDHFVGKRLPAKGCVVRSNQRLHVPNDRATPQMCGACTHARQPRSAW